MTNPLTAVPRRAARWSATHPWRAIASWVALVVCAVALASLIPTVEASDEDYRLGESGRAEQLVQDAGLDEPDPANVLVTGSDGAAVEAAAADVPGR